MPKEFGQSVDLSSAWLGSGYPVALQHTLPCANRVEILQISVQTSVGSLVGILGTAWGGVSALEVVLIPCFLF